MLHRLTEPLREELKKPFGPVIRDVQEIIGCVRSRSLITVGDTTTDTALENGLHPLVCVYDGVCLREERGVSERISEYSATLVEVENPAGHLSHQVINAVRDALSKEDSTKIYVKGEEDLVALAAIKYAPHGAIVLYGQPHEGIVYVVVDDEIRNRINRIIDSMDKIEG